MLSIVIPVFNRLDLTTACVASLRRHPPTAEHEIIVVDNGSTDGTGAWLAAQPDLVVVSNSTNRGFAAGTNQGVEAGQGDVVVLCNNDVEVDPGFADATVAVLEADPGVVAVGSRLLYPGRATIQHAGVVLVDMEAVGAETWWGPVHIYHGRPADEPAALERRRYRAMTAALLTIRRDAYDAVGGLDEGYWNGYEDIDLCLRFDADGGTLVYEPTSVAVHHESQSGPERFVRNDANVQRLTERWSGEVPVDFVATPSGTILAPGALVEPYELPVRTAV